MIWSSSTFENMKGGRKLFRRYCSSQSSLQRALLIMEKPAKLNTGKLKISKFIVGVPSSSFSEKQVDHW